MVGLKTQLLSSNATIANTEVGNANSNAIIVGLKTQLFSSNATIANTEVGNTNSNDKVANTFFDISNRG